MPALYTGCGALRIRREGMDGAVWQRRRGCRRRPSRTAWPTAQSARSGSRRSTPWCPTASPLRYPAGKIGGFDRKHAPAFTTTANVIGDLLIVSVPRGGNRLMAPMTMTWRASDGVTIKTFDRLWESAMYMSALLLAR
jgi:hypothetical protein